MVFIGIVVVVGKVTGGVSVGIEGVSDGNVGSVGETVGKVGMPSVVVVGGCVKISHVTGSP